MSTVERLFPYVTVVLAGHKWPPRIPAAVSQRVALHLNAASLPTGQEQLYALLGMMDKYDFIIEVDTKKGGEAVAVVKELRAQRAGRASRSLYILPQ